MKKDRKKLINFIGSEKMTKEEINQKTSLCFLLNPNIPEEEKNCVIEKVMATKAIEAFLAGLKYNNKQIAELDCQMNRNKFCYSCTNATDRCFRNEIGCPCEKYKSYKDENVEMKKQLTKAKEIIKEMLSILPKENIEGVYEITEEVEQFLRENE